MKQQYKAKVRTRREETAIWAVEEAVRTAKQHGIDVHHSQALSHAVAALLAVIEEELS